MNAGGAAAGRWPGGKTFAWTIMDDTDNARRATVKPFYDALRHYGLLTTKTVWSLPSLPGDRFEGDSLSDPEHRAWIRELAAHGFEIGWHGARSGGTERALNDEALEIFRATLGSWPRTYANHATNVESIYWGKERFDPGIFRLIYAMLRTDLGDFAGTRTGTPHYWGDLCRARIAYVRGFSFNDVVTTAQDPWMPYHDARRPDVRAWFSASNGPDVNAFVKLLAPAQLDRLEASGGACIVYAHAASGFVADGRLDPRVERVFRDVASREGWFVPTATLLEHLERARGGLHEITRIEHQELEARWTRDHVGAGLRNVSRRILRRLRRPHDSRRVSAG